MLFVVIMDALAAQRISLLVLCCIQFANCVGLALVLLLALACVAAYEV